MPANKLDMVNVQQYTESINEYGELVVSGQIAGQDFAQTIAVRPPCALFFDPNNSTLYVLQDLREWQPQLKLISIITSVTP